MDVLTVYMRIVGPCTPFVDKEFCTELAFAGTTGLPSGHSGIVSISRRLPPPLWVLAVFALSVMFVPRADAANRWVWPIVGPVIRAFDKPETDYSNGHRGIDIGAIRGREVRSPVDGVVWFAGVVAGRPVISIDTADGFIVSIEPVESSVVRGDVVRAGDSIGLVAAQHDGMNAIHLGVRVDGVYVDPIQFLGTPPRIVVYDSWIEAYALG